MNDCTMKGRMRENGKECVEGDLLESHKNEGNHKISSTPGEAQLLTKETEVKNAIPVYTC